MAASLFGIFVVFCISCIKGIYSDAIVSGEQCIDVGENVTLYCTPTGTSVSFTRLQWRDSRTNESESESNLIIQFTVGSAGEPLNRDRGHYMFDKDDPKYPLTIIGFTEADVAKYWCRLNTNIYGDLAVRSRVPPTSITMLQGTQNLPDGANVELVKDEMATFTCSVPDICPEARFTWMLGGNIVPSGTLEPNTPNPNGDENDLIITSSSTVTFKVQADHNTKTLECRATNKLGEAGVTTYVTMKVEEPPTRTSTIDTTSDGTTATEGSQTSTVGSTSIGSSSRSPEMMTPTTGTSTSSTGSVTPTTDMSTSTLSTMPTTDTSTSSTGSTANQSSVSMSSSLSTSTPTHMTTNQSLIGGASEDPGSGDLSTGAIIAIAVGGFAVVVILIAVVSGGVMWKMKSHKTAVKPGDAKSGNKESDGGKKNEQKKDDG